MIGRGGGGNWERSQGLGRSSKEISHCETKKPNVDAGFGTLPTAPGSAWMMLGKRGARVHLHICKQGLHSCPDATSAQSTQLRGQGQLSSVYSALEERERRACRSFPPG